MAEIIEISNLTAIIIVAFKSLILLISGFLCGAISERLAVRNSLKFIISARNWNFAVKLLVSALVVAYFESSSSRKLYDDEFALSNILGGGGFIDEKSAVDLESLSKFIARLLIFTFATRFGSALQAIGLTGGKLNNFREKSMNSALSDLNIQSCLLITLLLMKLRYCMWEKYSVTVVC